MGNLIVVLNAGSSSLKFTIYADTGEKPEVLYDGQIEGILTESRFKAKDGTGKIVEEKKWPAGSPLDHEGAIDALFAWGRGVLGSSDRIAAVGHRVVHGGLEYTKPTIVNDQILGDLEKFIPLAPLHQPHNLAAIRIIAKRNPGMPQVACFDTSFHTSIPAVAQAFALPRKYTEQGVRRYGFHGLSYEYIASVLPGVDPEAAKGSTVVAHLGNGASMCAMRGQKARLHTGIHRRRRPDDGYALRSPRPGRDALSDGRVRHEHTGPGEAHLQGIGPAGRLGDFERHADAPGKRRPRAAEAVKLFVYRITRELGSLAAALGGLDALVFTGGIGENAAPIRERVCRAAEWLGLEFDEKANAGGGPRISRKGSRVRAWVIPTDEELMIARHTRQALSGKSS